MKVNDVKQPDDVVRYIEACLNDFEMEISTKEETLVFLAELVVILVTNVVTGITMVNM